MKSSNVYERMDHDECGTIIKGKTTFVYGIGEQKHMSFDHGFWDNLSLQIAHTYNIWLKEYINDLFMSFKRKINILSSVQKRVSAYQWGNFWVAWINIPAMADDDYVINLATLWKNSYKHWGL